MCARVCSLNFNFLKKEQEIFYFNEEEKKKAEIYLTILYIQCKSNDLVHPKLRN